LAVRAQSKTTAAIRHRRLLTQVAGVDVRPWKCTARGRPSRSRPGLPLLSRFAPRAGLVNQRQTFVRRCHVGAKRAARTREGSKPLKCLGRDFLRKWPNPRDAGAAEFFIFLPRFDYSRSVLVTRKWLMLQRENVRFLRVFGPKEPPPYGAARLE